MGDSLSMEIVTMVSRGDTFRLDREKLAHSKFAKQRNLNINEFTNILVSNNEKSFHYICFLSVQCDVILFQTKIMRVLSQLLKLSPLFCNLKIYIN